MPLTLGMTPQMYSMDYQIRKATKHGNAITNQLISGKKNVDIGELDIISAQKMRQNDSDIMFIDNFLEELQKAKAMTYSSSTAVQKIVKLLEDAKRLAVGATNTDITVAKRCEINTNIQKIFEGIDYVAANTFVGNTSLIGGGFSSDVHVEFAYNKGNKDSLGDGVDLVIPGRNSASLRLGSTGTNIAALGANVIIPFEAKQLKASAVVFLVDRKEMTDAQFNVIRADVSKELENIGLSNFTVRKGADDASVSLEINGIQLTTNANVNAVGDSYKFKVTNIFNTPGGGGLATSRANAVGALAIRDHINSTIKQLGRNAGVKIQGMYSGDELNFNIGNCYCANLFRGGENVNIPPNQKDAADRSLYYCANVIPVIDGDRDSAKRAVRAIDHALDKINYNLTNLSIASGQINNTEGIKDLSKKLCQDSNIALGKADYSQLVPEFAQVRASNEVVSSIMAITSQQQLKDIMKLLRVLE